MSKKILTIKIIIIISKSEPLFQKFFLFWLRLHYRNGYFLSFNDLRIGRFTNSWYSILIFIMYSIFCVIIVNIGNNHTNTTLNWKMFTKHFKFSFY